MNGHIGINYEEFEPYAYSGVKVRLTCCDDEVDQVEIFNTGDVVADFIEASFFYF